MYDINKIKMIISDVDGVWTDGSIYKGHSSTSNIELKKFSISDGAVSYTHLTLPTSDLV